MAGSRGAVGGGMGRWTPRYCRSMARVGTRRFIFKPTEGTHQTVSKPPSHRCTTHVSLRSDDTKGV